MVGLGAGAVACYRRPGQRWTFYEIDPLVERIARDQRYFHYLAECAPDAAIRSGDARLTLQDAAPASYDLLILDAFSSDAIPMHLMTREALALYLDKLAPGGVIAWHVSNRNLDLAPIVADLAADAGVVAWGQVGSAIARRARRLSQPVLLDRARATCRGPGAAGRRSAVDPAAGPARRAALDRRLLQHPQRSALATAPLSTKVFPATPLDAADGGCARKGGFEARLGANRSFRRGTRGSLVVRDIVGRDERRREVEVTTGRPPLRSRHTPDRRATAADRTAR